MEDIKPGLRIAVFMLDFERWELGRTWSYAASYAIVDGLRAHGAEVTVIPSIVSYTKSHFNPWIDLAPSLLKDEKFDQAWIWVTHSYYSSAFWNWVRKIAPVRIGVLMESLRYLPDEVQDFQALNNRFETVTTQLQAVTHILTYDELDAKELNIELRLPVRLFHQMLPASLIKSAPPPIGDRMIFLGTLYPKRERFLKQEGIADLLNVVTGPERDLGLDDRFDELNKIYMAAASNGQAGCAEMAAFASGLQHIRRQVLVAVLDTYRTGYAMINLPALFKSFPGRVLEAMAAGVPVICNLILDRPDTAALFSDGSEILYYDPEVPGDLRQASTKMSRDPAFRNSLAANARHRVMSELTSEKQIGDILNWLSATAPTGRSFIGWFRRRPKGPRS